MVPENRLDDYQRDILKQCGDFNKKSEWIQGFAGSGKTVLLVHLIKESLLKDPDKSICVLVYTHALKDLIHNCNTKHLLISYNSEGLISHDEIYNILSQIGKPFVHEIQYRKYKSNNGTKEKTVTERIYYVKKRI